MEFNKDESCEISHQCWVIGSCQICHDPTWNLTGMNLVRSHDIVRIMQDLCYDPIWNLTEMNLVRSRNNIGWQDMS